MKQELIKGRSGNGQRKAYNHIMATGVFGVAEKVKEFRKNDKKRKFRK